MKYIKCIKDTALLTAGTWYGIRELNFYGAIVTVFRPSDNDWVMSDKENFDMGFLLDNPPDFKMKEFQNKQHKRLHNALIGAGFTNCGGKNLPNDTVKEFKEQKQEIAIKLNDALSSMLELKPNLASNIVADQIKAINELQPPRPVCITCNYFGRKPIGGVRDTLVDDSCWGLEEVKNA